MPYHNPTTSQHHTGPTSQPNRGCKGVGRQALVGKEKELHIMGKVVGPSEDTPVVCDCLEYRC